MSGKAETRKHMVPIKIHGVSNVAILRELIDEFISPAEYEIIEDDYYIFKLLLFVIIGVFTAPFTCLRAVYKVINGAEEYRPSGFVRLVSRVVPMTDDFMGGKMIQTTDRKSVV